MRKHFFLGVCLLMMMAATGWLQAAPAAPAALAGTYAPTATTRITVGLLGADPNADTGAPVISANGRFIAFASEASNLVVDDNNGFMDVFVHDRWLSQTERVSLGLNGAEGDGSTGEDVDISADGRFIVFASGARNMVANDTNNKFDVFLYDRHTAGLERISLDGTGNEFSANASDPSVSADGRFVLFLVSNNRIYLRDRQLNTVTLVYDASLDGDVAAPVAQGPEISGDGRLVAFLTNTNLLDPTDDNDRVDVYVIDVVQDALVARLPQLPDGTNGNDDTRGLAISSDGSTVAFATFADNLLQPDVNDRNPDTYVFDVETGTLALASVSSSGEQAILGAERPSLSWNGRFVAFQSGANNLVADDTNGLKNDVFVRDLMDGITVRASVPFDGGEWTSESRLPSLSGDGRFTAFLSQNDNVPVGSNPARLDAYVRDLAYGRITQTAAIANSGGVMPVPTYGMTVTIASNSFNGAIDLTVNGMYPSPQQFPLELWGVGPYFELSAALTSSGQPISPANNFTISVQYSPLDVRVAMADTLSLYRWDGTSWVEVPATVLDQTNWTITAVTNQLGLFAVAGETNAVALPAVTR